MLPETISESIALLSDDFGGAYQALYAMSRVAEAFEVRERLDAMIPNLLDRESRGESRP